MLLLLEPNTPSQRLVTVIDSPLDTLPIRNHQSLDNLKMEANLEQTMTVF